ncbi:MFS transporter [Amycolatopsis cihanbeyliensis]|uniref:MFS transporter n=1 Tax=Amycolatopsis cihanbeyliensis TaxID=1128664 RepID=A0A542DCA1_AMYCI|nr:MFS transporter [Amycolatopsis cihanbeyliensis]TQJ00708.1 MFS transporter [Amycolatopsis cihanbeyliensis]
MVPLLAVLAAAGISAVGSAMTMVAIPWFVLDATGSGSMTGAVAAAETVGLLLSFSVAGTLVDRHGPRRISVLADLLTVPVVLAVPLFDATVDLPLPALAAMAFGIGLGRAPSRTAKQVLLPDAIARAGTSVERATAALESAHRVGDLFGALAAGALITVLGAARVLLLDAATLFLAASLIALLVPARLAERQDRRERQGYLADLREGARQLRGDHLLLWVAGLCAGINALFVGLYSVLVPAYGARVWQNSALVGVVIAAVGAGGLLGALLYGWLGGRFGRRAIFSGCFLLCGAPTYGVLAANPPAVVMVVLLTLCSFGVGPLNPVLAGLMYERVPVALRGRVFGALYTGAIAAMPLGALLAGALLDWIGLRPAVLVLGGICLAVACCPLMFRTWREMDAPPNPAALAAPG